MAAEKAGYVHVRPPVVLSGYAASCGRTLAIRTVTCSQSRNELAPAVKWLTLREREREGRRKVDGGRGGVGGGGVSPYHDASRSDTDSEGGLQPLA